MSWGTRFEALITEAEALLEPLICKDPCGVGGSQPGRHGNGCCFNTGIQSTSQEEHDVAVALRDLIAAAQQWNCMSLDPPTIGGPSDE